MEAAAGVDGAGSVDLLENIIDGRFESEIFQGRGHQTMTDVANQLNGIIDDLTGLKDRL